MSDKVEQALRMLSGPCPHNRPDSEAPRTKPNCLQCLSETAREVVAKEIEACGAGLVGIAGIPAILNIREAAELFASIARGSK